MPRLTSPAMTSAADQPGV